MSQLERDLERRTRERLSVTKGHEPTDEDAIGALAEIEQLQELLRGTGANRYWEGRWREEAADNARLRAENGQLIEQITLRQPSTVEKDMQEVMRVNNEPGAMTERTALHRVIRAWESLPGGRDYHPADIQRWLVEDMKPAMDAARAALKDTTLDVMR